MKHLIVLPLIVTLEEEVNFKNEKEAIECLKKNNFSWNQYNDYQLTSNKKFLIANLTQKTYFVRFGKLDLLVQDSFVICKTVKEFIERVQGSQYENLIALYEKLIGDKAKDYFKQTTTDGQGFVTFDAYKDICLSMGSIWSKERVQGTYIDPEETVYFIDNVFPFMFKGKVVNKENDNYAIVSAIGIHYVKEDKVFKTEEDMTKLVAAHSMELMKKEISKEQVFTGGLAEIIKKHVDNDVNIKIIKMD